MSTIARFRNPSSVQFIDTMNKLTSHTTFYLDKLPKSTKFTWQVRLVNLVQDSFLDVNRANAIKIKCEQDYKTRRTLLQNVLENMAALECFLSVLAQNDNYYHLIVHGSENDYPFVEWGNLIDQEVKLIKGVLKKDEEIFQRLCQ